MRPREDRAGKVLAIPKLVRLVEAKFVLIEVEHQLDGSARHDPYLSMPRSVAGIPESLDELCERRCWRNGDEIHNKGTVIDAWTDANIVGRRPLSAARHDRDGCRTASPPCRHGTLPLASFTIMANAPADAPRTRLPEQARLPKTETRGAAHAAVSMGNHGSPNPSSRRNLWLRTP
jgi:hypothetical protein